MSFEIKMSYLFNFSGKTNTLTADISPPLVLDPEKEYGLSLIHI